MSYYDYNQTHICQTGEDQFELIQESINQDSRVLFTREITPESIIRLFDTLGINLPGNVAVKLHSGEKGNQNYLRPEFVKGIVEHVGGTVVECNTAYPGARDTTKKHKELMEEHGWNEYFNVDIMDEEGPDLVLDIPNHHQIDKDYLGKNIEKYDSMLVLSHFKGHPMAGYGGALKQISIGCASSFGKKIIHNAGDPTKDIMKSDKIKFLESLADAASAVHKYFEGKIVYINIMSNMSVDCDCCAEAEDPCMNDIGILIGTDPIAIDQACIDLVFNSGDQGKHHLIERINSRHGLHTLKAAEDLGFGTRHYQLIDTDDADITKQESVNNKETIEDYLFTEGTIGSTTFLYDRMAKRVDTVLSDPKNVRQFNQLVNAFINKNISKLTKSGPCDMIAFTDHDHKAFHELFGFWYEIDTRPRVTSPNEIRNIVNEFCDFTKSKQTFIQTNSSQLLFYFVIRYFTMHQDAKSLNAALSIYALVVYPLMFSKYFKYGVIESVMKYTIDNLTDKFIFKKANHLFGALLVSIQNSYSFHKTNFKDAKDNKIIAFIQRIRNDQNSLFKKIANEYMKNYNNGNYARQSNEEYDPDTPIVDDVNNASTEVQNLVQKVTYPIIEDGIDLVRAEAAAKMSNVSISDCRHFLTLIIDDNHVERLQRFIEALLFLYIYEEHKSARDIRSQYFLSWAASLFKKTNSKNKNIGTINEILNYWAEETGIHKKFAREASRINYKKAIFFYIVLCIQKNA